MIFSRLFKKYYWLFTFLAVILFLFGGFFLIKNEDSPSATSGQTKVFKDFLGRLPTPAFYPIDKNTFPLPELSGKSAIVLDVNSKVVLYQKNANELLSPASTTKMMTALSALETYRLEEVLTVGKLEIEGNEMGLVAGEQINVESLLYGLLVGSANDAALVLAESFDGGVSNFVSSMNQKAKELGLKNTHFTNPVGMDEKNHYSTARDLAELAAVAVKNPVFFKIVSTQDLTLTDVTGKIKHRLQNTNELVGRVEGVVGVKTGWTQNAGECLVSLTERNGEKVIIVILGSKDRFAETKNLIEWVFNNFEWKSLTPANYR